MRPGDSLELNIMSRHMIDMSWRSINRHEEEARDFYQVGLWHLIECNGSGREKAIIPNP